MQERTGANKGLANKEQSLRGDFFEGTKGNRFYLTCTRGKVKGREDIGCCGAERQVVMGQSFARSQNGMGWAGTDVGGEGENWETGRWLNADMVSK